MAKNEVKYGAVLSYILIAINSIYGLVIYPFLLSSIGSSEYGVYKTIASMTASIAVLDMGIGSTMQRYIAKFRALKDDKSGYNFSAMGIMQAAVIGVVIAGVGFGLYSTLDVAYGNSFSDTELMRAKQIFVLQLAYVIIHVFENVLFGIISGYNKFIFSNSLKIIMLASKVLLFLIVLPMFSSSLAIVIITLFIEIITIIIHSIYILMRLKHKIRLYNWDNALFKESFMYTILLFIQTILIQFNGNIDNMVIGAVIGSAAVTVYSFAIQIFGMYESFSTAISGVVLPTVTKYIYSGASVEELENLVKKFGRVQWLFLGGALCGFLCFGNDFFQLWLGEGFEDCWFLALILMIPVTFPLIVNVSLAILKAKNLLRFRTVSMAYSVAINVILTIVGTRYWGYWAAAVGTAVSTIIGSVISMNIYYHKKLQLRMIKIYKEIFKGITICLFLSSMIGVVLNYVLPDVSWICLIIKAGIFILTYILFLWKLGLNISEKKKIFR